MVTFRAFKGHLAKQEIADRILSPAYDTLNTAEARKMAAGNPLSFLNVVKPEINLPSNTDPYSQEVYDLGKNALKEFRENGLIVEDTQARVYIYKQQMGNHVQHGILGLTSIDDYERNLIKKHEFTLKRKEDDRTKIIDEQDANAEPVFLTF